MTTQGRSLGLGVIGAAIDVTGLGVGHHPSKQLHRRIFFAPRQDWIKDSAAVAHAWVATVNALDADGFAVLREGCCALV
jgi:hypothetical protein